MPTLQTEFDFTLPKGFVGGDGSLHRHGTMRLATARDEIEPLRDRSLDGPDDPYLTILVLQRVITRLGSLPEVGVDEVEGLFAADLAFLQDLYGIINFGNQADVRALQDSVLPDDFDDAEEAIGDSETMSVANRSEGGDEADPEPLDLRASRVSRIEEVVSTPRGEESSVS